MTTQIQTGTPSVQSPSRGSDPTHPQTVAREMVGEHRTGGGIDAPGLRRELDAISMRDPVRGAQVAEAVERQLTPVQRGEIARAAYGVEGPGGTTITIGAGAPSVADYRALPAGSAGRAEYDRLDSLFGDGNVATDDTRAIEEGIRTSIAGRAAPDAAGTRTSASAPAAAATDPVRLGLDLTQMALDLGGIVDPSGIADGTNAAISGGRMVGSLLDGNFSEAGGHLVNGGISLLGIAAGIGDLAKVGKIGKWAETVSDATRAVVDNPALRPTLEPALREIRDLVNRIPQGALDAMPASARESIESMKVQLDEFFGAGARNADEAGHTAILRGESVTLRGVDAVPVNYVKRDRAELATLRREFNPVREDFARHLTSDPARIADLRRAGLDDAAIQRLGSGQIPAGWQVHHKLPLDDGGTNTFDNLVLIKNDPSHLAITNEQRRLVGDLAVGESRQVNFPIPRGSVYPPAL